VKLIRDERGIIVGWIVKLFLGLALFGVALFEAGAIIVTRVSIDRISIDAAQEAGLEYGRTKSSTKAKAVAKKFIEQNEAELVDFEVLNNGDRILVTVEKTASTLFVDRIPGIKDYASARATNSAPVR